LDDPTSRGIVTVQTSTADSRAHAQLALALDGSEDSRTTLSIERLAPAWLNLWNRRRPANWPTIEAQPRERAGPARPFLAEVTAAARVRRRPFVLDQPRARLLLGGVNLDSDYLPFEVRDVDLDAFLTPDRVEIRRCEGHWPRGWAAFSAIRQGHWWRLGEGTARLAWACQLRVEDLLTTLPTVAETKMTTAALAAYARRPLVSGDLSGTGTLVLGWTASRGQDAGATRLTTKTLQGNVSLQNGQIIHPNLPAPITDINGAVQLSPQWLAVNRVRGRMLGTTATLGATIEGEPFFWNKPRLQCLIHTDIAIAEAARLAPDSFRPTIEKIEPRGNLVMWLSLAGPLRRPFRPEDLAATGTAVFRDVTFRSPSWALVGTVHDLQGQVSLDNGVVRLTTATGFLEQLPFSLHAEADPRAGRFRGRLESASPFVHVRQVMPRALSRWQVDGNMSGWFELEASDADLFQKVARLHNLTSETLANLPFQWDLRGEVVARDVEMTLENFPTSLTAINGRISLKGLEWKFEDLMSSWGKTERCRIGGGGRFRPGSWPTMHLELDAPVLYLDEWIRPWRRSHGVRIPPRVANPVFEMTGTIRGPRATYRGHPGENFRGDFTLESPYLRTDTFRFSNLAVDAYDGQISGQGQILFKRGASTCTLEMASRTVSLPLLIQCESGREQTFVGRLTGSGTFNWRNALAETLTARGRFTVAESKFLGNIFFRRLGQFIRIPLLDDVSFATIATPFQIANSRVTFDDIVMEGPMLSVASHGSAGFDHTLDFVLELGFPHLPQYAWLLDLIVQYFGKVPATVFSLDLRGSWDDPQYEFHQLSAAGEGLLDALEGLWNAVAPSQPGPPAKTSPK
jgi:hypothetical protein